MYLFCVVVTVTVNLTASLLQVLDAPACAKLAAFMLLRFSMPNGSPTEPIWQQPLNVASLLLPSVLDSCFALLDKLSTPAGLASSSSSSCSDGSRRGGSTKSSEKLVRALFGRKTTSYDDDTHVCYPHHALRVQCCVRTRWNNSAGMLLADIGLACSLRE
jgi:hypothetical protein